MPTADLSAPGRDATGPQLAMAGNGETVAVWARQNGVGGYGVQASTRSPGAAFAAPVDLAANAFDPDVAMTPGGEAVAAWRKFDAGSGNYVIQAATRPAGGSFSVPAAVSISPTAAQPQELQVATNASGAAAIVWRQKDPGSAVDPDQFSILAAFRPPGGAFSAPVLVSPAPVDVETEAGSPRVAVDLRGDTVIVWSFDTGTESVVEGAIRTAGGIVGAPAPISAAGESAFSPVIAAPPFTGTDFIGPTSGAATVAWTRSDGTDFIAEAATASALTGFSTPVPLSAPGADAGAPTVAAADAEHVRVAWVRQDGGSYRVEAVSGDGSSFSAPQPLSAGGANAFEPTLAASSGGATIAWKRSNGLNEVIEAATAAPGGGFSAPTTLSAAGQTATAPAVAMDGFGDATVTWLRSNGANEIVQVAGYDGAAPVLANVSIPASGTVGVPVAFAATPFDVWPIASTKIGFGDGSGAAGSAASHVYSAPGTYVVTITTADAAGTAAAASGAVVIRPSNRFAIGKLSRNKKKGTATLVLTVPGPGQLVLSGKGVKRAVRRAAQAGSVTMPIVTVGGKTRKKLAKRGRVKVGLAIAFTPDGGDTLSERRTVKLIKKLPRAAS